MVPFSANRTSTPSYNDPPPEYEATVNPHQSYINHGASFETAATGLSQSCSCMTQLTTVADDYGKRLAQQDLELNIKFQLLKVAYSRKGLFKYVSTLSDYSSIFPLNFYPELVIDWGKNLNLNPELSLREGI